MGGRGSSSGMRGGGARNNQGGGLAANAASLNEAVNAAYEQSIFAGADAAVSAVGRMEIGNTIAVKDYKTGTIREFQKRNNGDTISAFMDIRDNNVMASRTQVESWVRDSVIYAKYKPIFK